MTLLSSIAFYQSTIVNFVVDISSVAAAYDNNQKKIFFALVNKFAATPMEQVSGILTWWEAIQHAVLVVAHVVLVGH